MGYERPVIVSVNCHHWWWQLRMLVGRAELVAWSDFLQQLTMHTTRLLLQPRSFPHGLRLLMLLGEERLMGLQNGTEVLQGMCRLLLLSPVHSTLKLQRALQRAMYVELICHLMMRHRSAHAMLVKLVLKWQLQRWLLWMPHGTLHLP